MSIHALQVVPPAGKGEETQHDGLLHLAKNLNIHPDLLIGDGNEIVGTGMPGAGKTTLMALFLEQFGACGLPFSAFDLEGDLRSVVDFLPRGVLGTIDNCPTAQDMYEGGLQVVFDLASWGDDSNHAAHFINRTIRDLLSLMKSLPQNDRVPFLIGLDEAAYWLPQIRKGKDYLKTSEFEALFSVFHSLATRGRKMGLVPMLFTQRFADIHKDVLSPGTYIFMHQTTDTDLERYMDYISSTAFGDDEMTRKQMMQRISTFKKGQAIIKLPSGKQGLVQFHNRQSPHISHAPKTQAAANLYRNVAFDRSRQYGASSVSGVHVPVNEKQSEKGDLPGTVPTERISHTSLKEQVFALLDSDPNLSSGELARATGYSPHTVRGHRESYFALHPEKSKRPPTIKEQVFKLLDHDPCLSNTTIATILKHPTNTIQLYRNEYFVQHPDKNQFIPPKPMGKIETAVRDLLAVNPNYTAGQISYRTGHSCKDINKVLARIQAETEGGQP